MSDQLPDLDPDTQHMLRELMGVNHGLLVQTFLQDIQQRQADLHRALAHSDWEQLRRTAHSLRGSCADMGALALQQAGAEAEAAAANHDAQTAIRCCERIDQLCLRLCGQLVSHS